MYIWDDNHTEYLDEVLCRIVIKQKMAALYRLINWIGIFGSQA